MADTLEMEEDIGKIHVVQKRRPVGPIKELEVGNAGSRAWAGSRTISQSPSFVL